MQSESGGTRVPSSAAWQSASVPPRQRVRHGLSDADELGCCRRMLPQSGISNEPISAVRQRQWRPDRMPTAARCQ